jgi:hypothetical protein
LPTGATATHWDQIINARLLDRDVKVGVEVEKGEEDGLFTREGVCMAVIGQMGHPKIFNFLKK